MKRMLAVLAILLTLPLAADEPKRDDYNDNRDLRSKVFEVHNRSPREIYTAVRLLGSGFKGADLSLNEQLGTITARDFPENLAGIEEAIKRLDKAAPPAPDIELRISVLIASKGEISAPPVPDDLAGVVKQLQSALRYSHFAMLTTALHHTKAGIGIESSGVAEPTALGMTVKDGKPIFYTYRLRDLRISTAGEHPTLNTESFRFSMRVPVEIGASTQYQDVGFETPVMMRDGEKLVIGTTTMGEKALIVVMTAHVH